MWGYPASYLLGGIISALALPFQLLSRQQDAPADFSAETPDPAVEAAAEV